MQFAVPCVFDGQNSTHDWNLKEKLEDPTFRNSRVAWAPPLGRPQNADVKTFGGNETCCWARPMLHWLTVGHRRANLLKNIRRKLFWNRSFISFDFCATSSHLFSSQMWIDCPPPVPAWWFHLSSGEQGKRHTALNQQQSNSSFRPQASIN